MSKSKIADLEAQLSAMANHLAALTANPAASVALPGFIAQPQPKRKAAAAVQAAPNVTRTYQRAETGVSKSGHPYIVFTTATKNGGTFRCYVPADLVAAIRAGL